MTVTATLGGSSLSNSVILNATGGPPVLSVGPGKTYGLPCQAFAAATDGALVQIDASGTYSGDVCTITANEITVRGINGRPQINAAGLSSGGKGTWVFTGNNVTVDTIELAGATNTGNNGAGIWMGGQNLTVLNSYVHDNQEGILTAPNPNAQILIQSTELNHNGFGDGLTHNVDIGSAARLTMQYSDSHNANAGDLLNTAASENYILFNRLTSEAGTTNTEINLANGGRTFVVGNLIEKGANDQGGTALGYLLDGATSSNPSSELYVVNNTFVNDKGTSIIFLNVASSDPTPALATNNIFYGAGTLSTQTSSVMTANLTSNPLFVNQPGYDYHLTSGSPAIDTGINPSQADGVSLLPVYQYLDPSCGQARAIAGIAIDVGAYEYGGAGTPLSCALAVEGLSLSPTTVTGGTMSTANTITLTVPAPSSGTAVTLTSSNSKVASVPASLTVPSGAVTASFNITTTAVTASTSVTIAAAYSGGSASATLTVAPPASTLSALTCNPTSLTSGQSSNCTVTLAQVAPAGGLTVSLSDNNKSLNTPASVTVAGGATSATFTVKVSRIKRFQTATVTAQQGGASKSVKFTLSP